MPPTAPASSPRSVKSSSTRRGWPSARSTHRPFASVGALHAAMVAVMRAAAESEQLALIRAHPELAGRAMVRAELTDDSAREQSGAGLTQCSPDELARLRSLNARYNEKFGFPFILAVKSLARGAIIDAFARRVERDRATEFAACLDEIARIAALPAGDVAGDVTPVSVARCERTRNPGGRFGQSRFRFAQHRLRPTATRADAAADTRPESPASTAAAR